MFAFSGLLVVESNLDTVALCNRHISRGVGKEGSEARMLKPALEEGTGTVVHLHSERPMGSLYCFRRPARWNHELPSAAEPGSLGDIADFVRVRCKGASAGQSNCREPT